MNPRALALLIPLLTLACRRTEVHPRPAPKIVQVHRTPVLGLKIQASSGVESAGEWEAELQTALIQELEPWGPRIGAVPPGTPILRVEIRRYQVRPALNPAYAWVYPGVVSTGAGVALISAQRGVDTIGPALLGFPALGAGLAFIAIGSAFGGRTAYLDKRRGYPLHPFKAQVRLEHMVGGERVEFNETYRHRNLASEARPLAIATPEGVRREMARALAIEIRRDLDSKFEVEATPSPDAASSEPLAAGTQSDR